MRGGGGRLLELHRVRWGTFLFQVQAQGEEEIGRCRVGGEGRTMVRGIKILLEVKSSKHGSSVCL